MNKWTCPICNHLAYTVFCNGVDIKIHCTYCDVIKFYKLNELKIFNEKTSPGENGFPKNKMPKCTNCNGKMLSFWYAPLSIRTLLGYICKECNSFIFTTPMNKRLSEVFIGLEKIKDKSSIW